MARDLLSGGLFFVGAAVLAFVAASALPLWWFSTTELEGQMCSCGTGLWTGNVTWGKDLTQPNMLGGAVRCSADSPIVVQGCDAGFRDHTESRTKGFIGGVFSILAVLLAGVSFGFGFAVLERQPGPLDVIRFRKSLCWAALAALVAMFAELTTIGVFMSSPLFDNLSYDFGCHFQFMHPLNSNALKCHALGPSFGLAVGGCILCAFACIMFYLAFKNPHYMDPSTGRYSMFQETLLGARPLDRIKPAAGHEADYVRLTEDEPRGLGAAAAAAADSDTAAMDDGAVHDSSSPLARAHGVLRLYTVPLLLLLNGALFVWSNCSNGATVEPNVAIQFPSELHWLAHKLFPHQVDAHGTVAFKDDVFNFTLFTSLHHFWKGHAYWLAFLIGVFSGCWPYVKIFTMMFLWFVPSTEKLRGKLLHWLDVLGKWSLIDAYVLCLMAVAFGFNTDRTIMGVKIHVDISVRPGWGVYSFVLATMWSLGMSHMLTHMHRHAIERRELSPAILKAMSVSPHESLATRAYAPFLRRRRYACSRLGQIIMWSVLILTLLVNLLGQLLSTFEFRFSGLAELILPEDKRNTAFSLVSNGALLPDACAKGGFLSGAPFWNWFMTVMYFMFAMVIPLAMLVALAVLWGTPMTLTTTKKVFHLCQFLQSWAALDVFLVSIIAAVLEIGGLSEAVIGDAFGSIQEEICHALSVMPQNLLQKILKAAGLSGFDPDECALFRVDAVLMEGCWMLLYSVAAWGICTHLIMEFAGASIEERTRIIKVLARESDSDDSPPDPYEVLRIFPGESSGSDGASSESAGDGVDQNVQEQVGEQANQPSLAPPTRAPAGITLSSYDSSLEDDDLVQHATTGEAYIESVYLRRILQAQEEGARRFMGTYFGDCMYGPFPRQWWQLLWKGGVLYKVEWNKVGFDVHAALLMQILAQSSQRHEDAAGASHSRTEAAPSQADWEPRSPLGQVLAET